MSRHLVSPTNIPNQPKLARSIAVKELLSTVSHRRPLFSPSPVLLLLVLLSTGRLPGDSQYRALEGYPDALELPHIKVVRLDSTLNFVNSDFVKEQILCIARVMESAHDCYSGPDNRPPPLTLVLDAAAVTLLDFSGMVMLKDMADDLRNHKIRLLLADTKAELRDILRSSPTVGQ